MVPKLASALILVAGLTAHGCAPEGSTPKPAFETVQEGQWEVSLVQAGEHQGCARRTLQTAENGRTQRSLTLLFVGSATTLLITWGSQPPTTLRGKTVLLTINGHRHRVPITRVGPGPIGQRQNAEGRMGQDMKDVLVQEIIQGHDMRLEMPEFPRWQISPDGTRRTLGALNRCMRVANRLNVK